MDSLAGSSATGGAAENAGEGADGGSCDPARVESSLSGSLYMRLNESSQVGSARRAVVLLARRLGLGETAVGTAALAITEVSKNMLQHAGGGELSLWWTPKAPREPSLEVLAIDGGPGMADVERCFTDGYSTAGTPGTGLGAVRRAACALDVYAPAGGGTVMWFRLGEKGQKGEKGERCEKGESGVTPGPAFSSGAVCVPMPGEEAIGDAWALCETGGGATALVSDGLGHGPVAAEASRAALTYFCDHYDDDVEAILEGMAPELARTRGAAVGAARWHEGRVRFAGVGNIAAVIEHPGGERRHLVSQHGTLGQSAGRRQRTRAFEAELAPGALLILHSDGINTRWKLADYPGLIRRHPGVVAGALHRDFRRQRDDSTVLVVGRKRSREVVWDRG